MFQFAASSPILAHQGGWDEILLVGGPIVVIIALLAIAKRRVDAHVGHDGEDAHPSAQP
jgi:hypothetical protein